MLLHFLRFYWSFKMGSNFYSKMISLVLNTLQRWQFFFKFCQMNHLHIYLGNNTASIILFSKKILFKEKRKYKFSCGGIRTHAYLAKISNPQVKREKRGLFPQKINLLLQYLDTLYKDHFGNENRIVALTQCKYFGTFYLWPIQYCIYHAQDF